MGRIASIVGIVALVALGALFEFLFGSFVPESDAINAAQTLGLTNVHVTSRQNAFVAFSGCSDSDDALFHLTGTNAAGQPVNFIVCAGWPFKKATVRS